MNDIYLQKVWFTKGGIYSNNNSNSFRTFPKLTANFKFYDRFCMHSFPRVWTIIAFYQYPQGAVTY